LSSARLGLLALLATLAAPTAAGASVVPVSTFGSFGSGPGQLNQPGPIAVSADTGDVYVTDVFNGALHRYTAAGAHVQDLARDFNVIRGVALDPVDGTVYASDNGLNTVRRFRPTASGWDELPAIIAVTRPTGLAVDPRTRELYVIEADADRILRFNPDGTPDGVFAGGSGTADGQLDAPYALTVDPASGDVYVSDYLNDRVQRFGDTGVFEARFAYAQPGPIAIDPASGDVYIAQLRSVAGVTGPVDRVTTAFSPVLSFATIGSGFGQHDGPNGIAFDCTGELLVSDRYNHRVVRWRDDAITDPPCPRPTVVAGGARLVASDGATLTGAVDPEGLRTTYRFEYGTDPGYGASTAPATLPVVAGTEEVSAPLTGLTPSTTYHYRLVAENRSGTTAGPDRTFTTGPAPVRTEVREVPVTSEVTREIVREAAATGSGAATQARGRVIPRGLTVAADRRADARLPYTYAMSGRVLLPEGTPAADACRGRVTVIVKRGAATLSTRRATLTRSCTWRSGVRFGVARRLARRGGMLRVLVRFVGSDTLAPVQRAATTTLRYGSTR